MSSKTVHLHIGLHRTGTTFLQRNLYRIREQLPELGYYFPLTGVPNRTGHHNIPYDLFQSKRFDPRGGTLKELVKEIDDCPHPNIILTSEDFGNLGAKQIGKLGDAFGNFDVRIIFCTRNQADAVRSMYARAASTYEPRSIEEFVDERLSRDRRLYFDTVGDRWTERFGKEAFIVRVYETIAKDVFGEMMRAFGLDLPKERWQELGADYAPMHVSQARQVLVANQALARWSTKLGLSGERYRKTIAPQVRRIGKRLRFSDSSEAFLTEEMRQRILRHYQASNERFSEQYGALPARYFPSDGSPS